MYAIRHKRTKKFVYGTDKRYPGFRQRTSDSTALLFESYFTAHFEFKERKVSNKLYEIVPVELVVKGEEREHDYR
ncbi:hypothetical protein [Listeria newyorkensis]|uniref:Uncharacterized protein n=1 Tax=Listeria newyorkensis TaxID=1497681 RepID=A0A841Z1Y3_9LIST|nr:hypothetical protein [Listeria newyorkensis]MBC1459359.1 hypothetical protein [Listeria newyorkensis]